MPNSDDDNNGFEDEFMDESFDAGFDDSFDDDFDDGSDEMSDDDWDDSIEEEYEAVGSEKKKSGLSFNTIVIGGAVILGLGVLAFQVMTSKPSQVVGKFASALNMSGATDGPIFGERGDPSEREEDPTEEEATTEIEVDEQGFLFEPEILDEVEVSLNDSPPMPSPVSQVPEVISAEEDIVILDANTDAAAEAEVIEPVAVETEVTTIDDMITDVAEEEIIEIVEVAPEPIVEFEEPTIEMMEAETPVVIEQPDTQIQAPVQNVVATSDMSGLEKKLDMIVARLDGMEEQIAEIRESNESQVNNIKKEMASMVASKPVVKSTPKKAAPKKATPKKAAPKKAVSQTKSWELRAAQPGKAWVSEKGQKQIKPVSVGDNLPGIGRITDISYISNKWVVQGTSGKIQQ